jgi:large subunit ribosomal protein L29
MAKKAKQEDYRSLDNQGLADKVAETKLQLKRLKFGHAVNPIENPLTIRSLRREIARVQTEQTKRKAGI